MDSRLQSNEIRISKSTATSITENTSNRVDARRQQIHGIAASEEGQSPLVPDFDLMGPCPYFKSSFARSLSISSSNQTNSLDFGFNFGLARNTSIREEEPQPPALNAPGHSKYSISGENTLNYLPSLQIAGIADHSITNLNNSRNGSNLRNIWSACHKQTSQRTNFDTAEIEVLRLRKECQKLIEENRRLVGLVSGIVGRNLVVPGNSPNIEAVTLKTQVDTLQWQLKQVEASRQMYRAVLEEVVRFLGRCQRNLDVMQNAQIAQSKTVHPVHQNIDSSSYISNTSVNDNPSISRGRRSIDFLGTPNYSSVMSTPNSSVLGSSKIGTPINLSNGSPKSNSNCIESTPSSPTSSYKNFRDFTWCRSPKRAISSPSAATNSDLEKLSQQAFRLLRIAQNLLNTQEPVLKQSKQALELQYDAYITPNKTLSSVSPILTSSLKQGSDQSLNLAKKHVMKSKSCDIGPGTFCMTFSRQLNMRQSLLSLRSFTDDSVHSNSSSKNETDEEILIISNNSAPTIKEIVACSTEDESGFSSISSIQEIGLPLNFSVLSTSSSMAHSNSTPSDDSGECHNATDTFIENDRRNSTLKAFQSPLLTKIELPLPPSHHMRWDSTPVGLPRGPLLSFSTLPGGDDAPRVLWV